MIWSWYFKIWVYKYDFICILKLIVIIIYKHLQSLMKQSYKECSQNSPILILYLAFLLFLSKLQMILSINNKPLV